MRHLAKRSLLLVALLSTATIGVADDGPQDERHEIMEGVRDAAKPLGDMLRGKAEYDADVVMESLLTWRKAGETFGDLFPDGSEGGEAAPAIWEDREGFDAALAKWLRETNAAIDVAPQTVAEAGPVVGAAFKNCKSCHDKYRIEDE